MKRVNFITIKSKRDKITQIIKLSLDSYKKREHLLIRVNDLQAGHYLDELLWSFAPESFLPHILSSSPTDELICITTSNQNLNNAYTLINLTERAIMDLPFTNLYEFEDQSPRSKELYKCYKDAGYSITLR